jgi:hypothetical protein
MRSMRSSRSAASENRVMRAFSVRGVPAKLAALAKLYGVDVLLLKPDPVPADDAADQRKPAT